MTTAVRTARSGRVGGALPAAPIVLRAPCQSGDERRARRQPDGDNRGPSALDQGNDRHRHGTVGGHRYAISASRSRGAGETRSCMLTIIPATRYTTVTQVHMRAPARCWSARAVSPEPVERKTEYATRSENTRKPERMSQGNVARKR